MNRPTATEPTMGSITDVPGVRVGHAHERRRGWRTGTTVVVVEHGATAGVDVRGGGPGTHETDLLRPENLVQQVHAVCLTGGSAYGLAATAGVMTWLEEHGIGFPVGPEQRHVVPIVPAAVIYDLGRGGVFGNRPDATFGLRAARAARGTERREGAVGAGTGAVAGGLQGGIGTACVRLADGTVVGALAVVNAAGSVIDPSSGRPWEWEAHRLRRPTTDERRSLAAHLAERRAPLNTTIGVVATAAPLTKSECAKVAAVAHDGLARAIRPAHAMFDGDTVFALSTAPIGVAPDPACDAAAVRMRAVELDRILVAAATAFELACTRAVLCAHSHPGGPPAYRDLCPSAYRRTG